MKVSLLSNRTMSSYPISIGTSLALESIDIGPNNVYDPDREIPNKVDLNKYSQVWFNLYTLFRNVIGSVESKVLSQLSPVEISDVLEQEISIIDDVIKQHNRNARCVFYTSDYAGLKQRYSMAFLRSDNTPLQKFKTELMLDSIRLLYRNMGKDERLKHFRLDIKPDHSINVLIMTGYVHDLCNHSSFSKLDLLESHTGVLKDKSLWYTKFHNGKELIRIPFYRGFLQVFGDSTLFLPAPRVLRQDVLELSEKYKWTASTTKDRIQLGISSLDNASHRLMLQQMFSA